MGFGGIFGLGCRGVGDDASDDDTDEVTDDVTDDGLAGDDGDRFLADTTDGATDNSGDFGL